MEENTLIQLIGHIYQSATDNDCAASLSDACAKAFDCESCLIYFAQKKLPTEMPEASGILSRTANFTDKNISDYVDYYDARNEWFARAWKNEAPYVVLGEELIDTPSLLRTEWSDYLHATDTLYVLGAQYNIGENLLGLIGVHRSPGSEAFGESDRRKMELLMPHFQRAMQIRERLLMAEQRDALSLDLLEKLEIGVILVENDCRILFANQNAGWLLQQRIGLTLWTNSSRSTAAYGSSCRTGFG